MGRGWSKKCKPIPAPPRGAGLKSHPIPAPPPLRGRENPYGAKQGRAGQAGRGEAKLPSLVRMLGCTSAALRTIVIICCLSRRIEFYICWVNNIFVIRWLLLTQYSTNISNRVALFHLVGEYYRVLQEGMNGEIGRAHV